MASRRFFRTADRLQQQAAGRLVRRLEADALRKGQDEPLQIHRPPLLTPDQACAYLGLPSVRAIYQRVRRGMPVVKVGRSLRFDQRELDHWMRRDRQDQTERMALVRRGSC